MKLILRLVKVIFTLSLTIFIARLLVSAGPAKWILQTLTGMDGYIWLLHSWGGSGIEDGEDMVIVLALAVAFIISTLTCMAVTRCLRRLRRRV